MLKLFNLSTYEEDLKVFNRDGKVLSDFLSEHELDGLELLIDQPWEDSVIPPQLIKGVHLRYWSNWLDLWRQDYAELRSQFGGDDNIAKYYGGTDKYILVENYRKEIKKAIDAGAEYAVFHVSNARLNELFSYEFRYSDAQVIDGTIEMVNAMLDGLDSNITLLFENLWWPGLTMQNTQMAARLLDKVNYPHKGFMLDTGHLMNTNRSLRTQQEGVEYLLATLRNLGELKQAIKGIHLHHSLSGEYVLQAIKENDMPADKGQIMSHILKIDQHLPFETKAIQEVVNYIQPNYLVHEFMFGSRAELSDCLKKQNAALGIV